MDVASVDRVVAMASARLPRAVFAQETVRERLSALPDDPRVRQWAIDLAIASACVTGDPAAIEYIEQELISSIPRYVRRFSLSAVEIEELKQAARIQMLCGPEPRISKYQGLGPLEGWFRMVVVRMAMLVVTARTANRETSWTEDIVVSVGGSSARAGVAEIALDRAALSTAVEHALMTLEVREKTLLKLTFVDGLNIEQVGRIYGVHRSTVARWLVEIRRRLFETIRSALAPSRRLPTVELLSFINSLRSTVDVNLSRILTSGP
jgi:RNA polymerase sigma-70 factor (ECF subfamily)